MIFIYKFKNPWLLISLFGLFIIFGNFSTVKAASFNAVGEATREIPNNGTIVPWLVVSRPGSNGMNGPESQVFAYWPKSQGSARIKIQDACDTSGNDRNSGNNDTNFQINNISSAVAVSGTMTITNGLFGVVSSIRCTGGTDITFDVNPNAFTETIKVDGVVMYKININAILTDKASGNYYVNRYRISVSTTGGKIGYLASNSPDNIDRYTGLAYDESSSNSWGWKTRIAFAKPCNTGTENANVYFYDTDHSGDSTSSDPYWQNTTAGRQMSWKMEIYNRSTGAYEGQETGVLEKGNNVTDSMFPLVDDEKAGIKKGYDFQARKIYVIEIYNINYINSIQIQIPYDQIYASDDCNDPPEGNFESADCTILTGWARDSDSTGTKIKVDVYEGGVSGVGENVGKFTANGARTDSVDGYGFRITVPTKYNDGKKHTFHLYALGVDINGNPDSLNLYLGERTTEVCPAPNTAPAGTLVVGCSAAGVVTISKVTVTDKQGGSMSIEATKPDGTKATGTGNATADTATDVLFSSNNTFSGIRDGKTYTLTGKVTDPDGLFKDLSADYSCPVPPPEPRCTITTSGFTAVGSTATVTINIRRSKTLYSPAVTVTPSVTINSSTITNPGVELLSTSPDDNKNSEFTITNLSIGTYPVSGKITWNYGGVTNTLTCDNTEILNIGRDPFFKVNNGDLSVGGVYSSGTSCAASGSDPFFGKLYSWTDRINSKGASSSHVAKILGIALDFYSASSTSSTSKKLLTIANSTGDWGGGSDSVVCMKDIYANTLKTDAKPISGGTLDLNPSVTLKGQHFKNDTNLVLSRSSGELNGNIAVYVKNGDVFIKDNINMASTYPTGNISQIPFFALIVKGNIYISPGVTNLDGLYVAQPRDDGTGGGTIFTCAKSSVPPFSSYTSADTSNVALNYFNNCANPLTFNGLVQAKDIKLLRTHGGLEANIPAETFNILPELYFAPGPFNGTTPSAPFDSVVTLPPLL